MIKNFTTKIILSLSPLTLKTISKKYNAPAPPSDGVNLLLTTDYSHLEWLLALYTSAASLHSANILAEVSAPVRKSLGDKGLETRVWWAQMQILLKISLGTRGLHHKRTVLREINIQHDPTFLTWILT